jgi:hypothetical protein
MGSNSHVFVTFVMPVRDGGSKSEDFACDGDIFHESMMACSVVTGLIVRRGGMPGGVHSHMCPRTLADAPADALRIQWYTFSRTQSADRTGGCPEAAPNKSLTAQLCAPNQLPTSR